jgi:hypothetical protein
MPQQNIGMYHWKYTEAHSHLFISVTLQAIPLVESFVFSNFIIYFNCKKSLIQQTPSLENWNLDASQVFFPSSHHVM